LVNNLIKPFLLDSRDLPNSRQARRNFRDSPEATKLDKPEVRRTEGWKWFRFFAEGTNSLTAPEVAGSPKLFV
jgi:hypothetical protein